MIDMESVKKLFSREQLPDRSNVGVLLLAGGKGKRLEGVTGGKIPKSLVEIKLGGLKFPMLDYGIATIPVNFKRLVVVTSTDPEAHGGEIKSHVLNEMGGVSVYTEEGEPKGTAGVVASYIGEVDGPEDIFVVSPTDTLFPFEKMNEIVDQFEKGGKGFCWVLTSIPGEGAQNTGKVIVEDDRIVDSLESIPDSKGVDGGMTSVGVVVFNKGYFVKKYKQYVDEHPDTEKVDMYRDFIPWLLEKDEKVGYLDIKQPAPDLGTPERLATVT